MLLRSECTALALAADEEAERGGMGMRRERAGEGGGGAGKRAPRRRPGSAAPLVERATTKTELTGDDVSAPALLALEVCVCVCVYVHTM